MVFAQRLCFVLMAFGLAASLAFAADEKPLSFAARGQPVVQLSMADLREKVPATRITVWEPHEDRNVTYEGFAADKLFDAVYGDRWKQADEVLFTCVDGYQPVLPVERFSRHAAYFVFRRLDQAEFQVQNRYQGESDVPLGPFYLVWSNLESHELRAEGASGWPYQVVGVDLVTFADRFPKLSPPSNASEKAKKGFIAFRENCMACHTINGEGGNKAPELNYPTSVTEYLSDSWIRKFMMDPRSVRYDATMPAFASHPDPDALVDEVLAYLKVMAGHKQVPE